MPDADPPTDAEGDTSLAGVTALALRAAVPLLIPAIPFGLVLGVAIADSAMPTAVAWSTNVFIFAGAAQLATVSLAATATWLTLVATAAVINLRHVMYSAALSPRFGDQPRWFRWIGPFLLIDQLFALTSVRTDLRGPAWRRFYLSAGIFYVLAWITTVTLGLVVGSSIPVEWRLDVAPAIMFAGLVVLGLSNRPGIVAAVVGAGVCLLALDVPNNGGILVGAVSGVIAGSLAEIADTRRDDPRARRDPT
jgi:predicted branched-subunit amino acid permease